MAKKEIINLLDKDNIANDLKVAYSFMLLSRGYTADEIKILDDYVFFVRKKGFEKVSDIKDEGKAHRRLKQRCMPNSPICFTSTSEVYNRRDHTLYSLNGVEPLTKGRLVWSIIKLYQQENSPTYDEVSRLFNYELKLPQYTVISESSLELLRPDKQRRFYYHEHELLEGKDGIRYAVTNQWSIKNMDEIITFAKTRGWKVEIVKLEPK